MNPALFVVEPDWIHRVRPPPKKSYSNTSNTERESILSNICSDISKPIVHASSMFDYGVMQNWSCHPCISREYRPLHPKWGILGLCGLGGHYGTVVLQALRALRGSFPQITISLASFPAEPIGRTGRLYPSRRGYSTLATPSPTLRCPCTS
jgi:hypothetical protein